jgi:hypothetical protein
MVLLLLDYNERISSYWPEFGQKGKGNITVRQLLNHQAGLVLLNEKIRIEELEDFDKTAKILSQATPLWEPGVYQETIHPLKGLINLRKMPSGIRKAMFNLNSPFMKSMTIIKGYDPNKRETWKVEQPSGNGIGTASSVAKLYSILATGGMS